MGVATIKAATSGRGLPGCSRLCRETRGQRWREVGPGEWEHTKPAAIERL